MRIHKGDRRAREMADDHYTRQNPGHPMWTRPGYNFVLLAEHDSGGRALFCWWRPKWEAGIERKDRLRCLECTIFRNENRAKWLSSALIRAAVAALELPEAHADLRLAAPWAVPDGLITGIGTEATRRGRSKLALPGACFRAAGWTELTKKSARADVWLIAPRSS